MKRPLRADKSWTCVCTKSLGHFGWRECFPNLARMVCPQCCSGEHLSCQRGKCQCVHFGTKPPKLGSAA